MSCSSQTSHNMPLLLAMCLSCSCIVVPLNQFSQMKTESRTQTGGAATRPGDRSAGNSSLNGSGT